MPTAYTYFLAAMAVFQILDIYTTHRVLTLGGLERNVVMDWLFALFGNPLAVMIAVKVLVMVALYIYPVPATLQVLLVSVYSWVVYNNFTVLKKLKNAKAN